MVGWENVPLPNDIRQKISKRTLHSRNLKNGPFFTVLSTQTDKIKG
jgi:hypothetical protein